MTTPAPKVAPPAWVKPLLDARPYLLQALQRGMDTATLEAMYEDSLARHMVEAPEEVPADLLPAGFAVSRRHIDFLTEEEQPRSAQDWEKVMVWVEWSLTEAFRGFSSHYVVQSLSGLTVGRWEAHQDLWFELTRDARRALWDQYVDAIDYDLGITPDWALPLVAGSWNAVEVPYVDAKPLVMQEAVPRDENGKEVKL